MFLSTEHNFMVSAAGRENFKNQLQQLGSIQMTNDLDVHVVPLTASSYQRQQNEKYMDNTKTTTQICREYVTCLASFKRRQTLWTFSSRTPRTI